MDDILSATCRRPSTSIVLTSISRSSSNSGPLLAILKRGDLTLWLAGPHASASRPMPDGRKPEPGGWNRFVVETHDLAATVAKLKTAGVRFRNEIVSGPGGQQILVEDPCGNVVELFQPA